MRLTYDRSGKDKDYDLVPVCVRLPLSCKGFSVTSWHILCWMSQCVGGEA